MKNWHSVVLTASLLGLSTGCGGASEQSAPERENHVDAGEAGSAGRHTAPPKGGTGGTGGTAGFSGAGGTAGFSGSGVTGGTAGFSGSGGGSGTANAGGAPDTGAACQVGDAVYPNGANGVPDPFSCNHCHCVDGRVTGCTLVFCPVDCKDGTRPSTSCSQCGPVDQCEVVETGCFPTCETDDDCAFGSCVAGFCGRVRCG